MIIISYGHTRGEVRKLLEGKKLLNVSNEIRNIDAASWAPESVDEVVASQGLFSSGEVFFVERVLSEIEPAEIKERVKELEDSPNVIVFIEGAPLKSYAFLEKHSAHVFKAPKKTEEKTFNIFSLTDALFEKDRKKLWILYERALGDMADPEEEVHRILFWGVKMLALAREYPSAESAGMSPFVYGKAKKGVAKYKEGELEKVAQDLTEMVVRARQGGEEWEILLEQFILKI